MAFAVARFERENGSAADHLAGIMVLQYIVQLFGDDGEEVGEIEVSAYVAITDSDTAVNNAAVAEIRSVASTRYSLPLANIDVWLQAFSKGRLYQNLKLRILPLASVY